MPNTLGTSASSGACSSIETVVEIAVSVGLVAGVFWLVVRASSPLRENLLGLVDALLVANLLWPLVFIAAIPVMLLLGQSSAQQLFLVFAYFMGTGLVLLWSGHRFQRPSRWIKGTLHSWRADGALDGDQESVARFSTLWRRRLGLALVALAVPVTAASAVAEWVSA